MLSHVSSDTPMELIDRNDGIGDGRDPAGNVEKGVEEVSSAAYGSEEGVSDWSPPGATSGDTPPTPPAAAHP